MTVETIKEQYRVARVVAMASVDWEVQARLDAPPVLVEPQRPNYPILPVEGA